ncbi:hypothetical protein FB451DRAFT_1208649 [Mycena latifolia]|nr:hypothetical protein FB451DRAFT_1208649 [Mycena latifolia]
MKKAKGLGSSLTKRNKKQPPEVSYNTSDVPPELWEIIASFSSRQSVARLCSLSHEFCSTFSVLLYSNLITPPLSPSQSSLLLKTLGDAQTSAWKPHPATLISRLGLSDGGRFPTSQTIKADTSASINGLKNLSALSPTRQSALRILHWHLAAGVDELGKILGAPGNFSNIKELVVSANGFNNNFNFVQIRGLEVLGLNFDLCRQEIEENYYEMGDKLCYKLAEAMSMLPSSSPPLRTLRLNFKIPLSDVVASPWQGYKDLVDTINAIHLPALVTLDLSIKLDSIGDEDADPESLPDTSLFPFLSSHPNLLDLNLNVRGTKLTNDNSFLPFLRSFQGSFHDAAVICACAQQLDKLVLTLTQPYDFFSSSPAYHTIPLPTNLSLTKLHVQAVDPFGSVVKLPDELSPASLAQLVSSFRNITHLDICLQRRITEYRGSLILLTKLQSLRIQEHRINDESKGAPRTWPLTKIYPPSDYIKEFDLFLPFLPHLAHIEIRLLIDHVDFFDHEDFDLLFSPPDERGSYEFSVVRGRAILVNAAATSREEEKNAGAVRH